jgi:alpha-mannosidase
MIQHEIERLQARLRELWAFKDLAAVPLEGQCRVAQMGWLPLEPGTPWPGPDFPVQMAFEGQVPLAWAGNPVWVRLRPGGEGLLLYDGVALGGLNPYHSEYPLLDRAKGGEVLALEVEAVPKGLFGFPVQHPQLEEAVLFIPDAQVRSLHTDLNCALEAAQHTHPDVARLLVDALSEALAHISLPRSPAEAYLARIHAVPTGTETVWENHGFKAEPVPLLPEVRERLEQARILLHKRLEEILRRYPAVGQLWLSGHAHIDLAWLWPVAETRRKIRRSFATVLHLMDRYPTLYFNQSSAQAYAWLEEDDPALFARLKDRVAEGRWEPVGGMWVEPDGNLLSGESWVRQILYGQRYFEKKFGRRSSVAWLPDTFGFAANLPQLLRQGDLPYFFTTKLNWNETNAFPHDLWQWEGLDGSRVLAHGFCNPNENYNGRVQALDLAQTWANFKGKRHHPASLLTFGYGDGGGGPSAEMMERQERYREFPGLPRTTVGRVDAFYQAIDGTGDTNGRHKRQGTGDSVANALPPTSYLAPPTSLPVWSGEMYLELHRATYTSQAQIKQLHRRLELLLPEAEAAWSFVKLHGETYPKGEIERLWKTLLLSQFHDILPGSHIHTVAQEAQQELRRATEEAQQLLQEALLYLSEDLSTNHQDTVARVVVWNFSSSARPLRLRLPRTQIPFRLMNQDWEEVLQQRSDTHILAASSDQVPAMGHLILSVIPDHDGPQPSSALKASPNLLENPYLRIEVGLDGTLRSVFDKQAGRETLAGRGNQIWAFTDIPRNWEAWDIDGSYTGEGQELLAERIELVEAGPVRAGLRVLRRIGESVIEQTYWLWHNSRRLEIETKAQWQERRTLLRAFFVLKVRSHQAYFETAFGAVDRPTHHNTSWDAARFEVPALRWADLSEAGYGVSLLNSARYGHSAKGNVLGLSLLRGAVWPDPYADIGVHQFSYALYPHQGDWRNGTVAEASDFNRPLEYVVMPKQGNNRLSVEPFLWADPGVVVSALKPAEDNFAYILRLYEAHGGRGVAEVDIRAFGAKRALRVGLLEDGGEALSVMEGKVRLELGPYQVMTIKLER